MGRDNFSKRTIDILRSRVNNACSNFGCKIPTVGPGAAEDRVVKLGRACHINAAAPGGPRYDKRMTPEERKGLSNGIWLCNSCADLIDKDASAYPESLLRTWKKMAEQRARAEMENGKSSIDVFDTHPSMHGVALFSEISSIDPRFAYQLKIEHGKPPRIELNAKEPIELSFAATEGHETVVNEKMTELVDFGKPFILDRKSISISGSDLFTRFGTDGTLEFGNPGKETPCRVQLYSGNDILIATIHAVGNAWHGKKGLNIRLPLVGDMVLCEMYFEPVGNGQSITLEMKFNFVAWLGVSIYELSNYNWMEMIGKCASTNGYLKLDVKSESKWIPAIKRISLIEGPIKQIAYTIEVINIAKTFARTVGEVITFSTRQTGDMDLLQIRALVDTLSKPIKHDIDSIDWPIEVSGVTFLEDSTPPERGNLRLSESVSIQNAQLFGQKISLPPRRYLINDAIMRRDDKSEQDSLFVYPSEKTSVITYYPLCSTCEDDKF